jgi:osmotically-inducible protein OsmY
MAKAYCASRAISDRRTADWLGAQWPLAWDAQRAGHTVGWNVQRYLMKLLMEDTGQMKNNAELQRDVLDELLWDPSVNAANIEVAADDGLVTLNGSIGSYTEKYAAERDARRVGGVVSVLDNLEVQLPPAYERTDADLVGAAKDAMRWNVSVPAERISVKADNGLLTLTGDVVYHFQREAAYDAVRFLVGVTGVNNQIRITPSVRTGEVKGQIEKALVRNAETDAKNIRVQADNGKVTLRGTVHSWAERDEAGQAAWAAPGVREVVNDLAVVA